MMYFLYILLFCIIMYIPFRHFFPPKQIIIEECYQYILNERNRYRGKYEFAPKNLERRFYKQVRGVTKYNRRKVAEAVIQKLIDNNIVELVPNICIDVYRAVYVEQK